jgi:N-acetylmuramoyl-L-alanine amidase
MKHLILIFSLLTHLLCSQSIQDCKRRFTTYLNYKGNLNAFVRFEKSAIHIYNAAGKKEFSIYENELPSLAYFLQNSTFQEQVQFWESKKRGTSSYLPKESNLKQGAPKQGAETKLFLGYRIAIDPGHFATTLKEAAVEQKFLYFKANKADFPFDSVKIFESALSFNTAVLLKTMLEKEGAEVFLSRSQSNYTSVNCTYSHWMAQHKNRVLDSLQKAGKLSPAKKASLQKAKPYDVFWGFFRDFDLHNRAEKINHFKPDLSVIIHFNVDEKNAPWIDFTEKNYTMAFIGGGFTVGNMLVTEMKTNFLRLLLSPQLDFSEALAAQTVKQFHHLLNIPIAKQGDATYLLKSSMPTDSRGVYCRNLLLCRQINSVLVYGEALYQDNTAEAAELMKWDIQFEGIATNQRVLKTAEAYFEGLKAYLKAEK